MANASGFLPRKVLITGNLGYIGPCVVSHLRETRPNLELVGYDTGFFVKAITSSKHFPEQRLDEQFWGDIRTIPEEVFSGVDAVIHLAGISSDPMGKVFESVTMEINHQATISLAKKAKRAGVRSFVFASSCSVYGAAGDCNRSEISTVNPLTPYARSKLAAEKDLKELADSNYRISCLRFSTACGMSPRLRLDLVLNDFVASAIALRKIEVFSDGTLWRPLINTKDMARAIDWAINRDDSSGGDYLVVNVGSDEWNYQLKDLAGAVQRQLVDCDVSINKNAQPDRRSYRLDFALFRKLAPDYQPLYDLASTIDEIKDGLEAIGFKNSNFRDSELIRLRMLKSLMAAGYLGENLYWESSQSESRSRVSMSSNC